MSDLARYYLRHRGEITGLTCEKERLIFVTRNLEGNGNLCRLNLDNGQAGLIDCLAMNAMTRSGNSIFLAGTDGFVYRSGFADGKPERFSAKLDDELLAITARAGMVAVLCASMVYVLAERDGRILSKLAVPQTGRSIEISPDGIWLAVGTGGGYLLVFRRDGDTFVPAASERIHDGATVAVVFDPDEHRVISAGSDRRVLITHALPPLEPEERAAAGESGILALSIGTGVF